MRTSGLLFLAALVVVGCKKSDGNAPPQGGPGPQGSGNRPTGPNGSRIEFVGTKPEGKHDGGFEKFTIAIDPIKDDLAGSKITVEIDTTSLWSDTPKLTAHLKSPDFFDVNKYPKASFVSTKVEAEKSGDATHKITGNLTLHGKTQSISFPAKIAVSKDLVTVDSEFTINRQDYGISYGEGKINNDVTIKTALRHPRK
jgi:polyisoprenoid-binding protein YceI